MRNTIEYYERRTARFGGMLAALPLAVLLLAALPVHAQTDSELAIAAMAGKVPVAIMRFHGDEEWINTAFREAVAEDVGKLQLPGLPPFSADIILPSGPYGAYQFTDEPPPPELTGGRHYALTGALFLDNEGKKHLQLWLWDLRAPALVYTDEMFCNDLESGRVDVTLMVEWIFSHISPDDAAELLREIAAIRESLAGAKEDSAPPAKVPDPVIPPEPQPWREKWLYFRTSFDYGIIAYQVDPSQKHTQLEEIGSTNDPIVMKNMQDSRAPFGFTFGLEIQFFSWMSLEGYGKVLFGDIGGSGFAPALGLELKIPLKPAKSFMVEPYAIVEFPLNSGAGIQTFSPYGIGGGLQFGVKGGEVGAFFLDAQFIYNVGDIYIKEPDDLKKDAHWKRWVFGFGIGYKIGFGNRIKAAN